MNVVICHAVGLKTSIFIINLIQFKFIQLPRITNFTFLNCPIDP